MPNLMLELSSATTRKMEHDRQQDCAQQHQIQLQISEDGERLTIVEGATIKVQKDLNETVAIAVAKTDNRQLFLKLLNNGASLEDRDTLGRNPIAVASINGSNQILQALKERNLSDEVNKPDNALATPLMHAAANDHPDALMLLHDMGADVHRKDCCEQTALTHAAIRGSERCVEALLKLKAEAHTLDYCGNTPLIWAARGNHSRVVRVLSPALDKPQYWLHRGQYQMSALQWAAYLGHREVQESIKECIRHHQTDATVESNAEGERETSEMWSEALEDAGSDVQQPTLDPEAVQERYPMSSTFRGVAMVINNVDPERPTPDGFRRREGAMCDTSAQSGLYQAFKSLGLFVELYQNTTSHFLRNSLLSVNRPMSDYTQHDVFVLCVMSHGHNGYISGSDNQSVELESLYRQVRECPELAGKPKIFVTQACRLGQQPIPTIRAEDLVDCLYIYSTSEGQVSRRDPSTGGVFAQVLNQVILNADLNVKEFSQLLPKVVNQVFDLTNGKQVVELKSTLRKQLYFPITTPLSHGS